MQILHGTTVCGAGAVPPLLTTVPLVPLEEAVGRRGGDPIHQAQQASEGRPEVKVSVATILRGSHKKKSRGLILTIGF